jgi:phosphopantothenoylcysteine decarboxylase/phosphopantothenate--cysteine ligase
VKLSGKKILLGVTGSIAAYKSAELCRLLVKEGAGVKVIMTAPASDFITPLTLSVVSGNPVYSGFTNENNIWNNHVDAGLWADLFLIAPATANTIAKMATGMCDNFLLASYLSSRCPVMIAPAMDHDMFLHEATQQNLEVLRKRKHMIVGPAYGELASGLTGEGRMEEPPVIAEAVRSFFLRRNDLKGKHVLITAGPTREAIDPVRYISNRSSGRMGFALAKEFADRGAEVTLVAGPNSIAVPQNIHYITTENASSMLAECMKYFRQSDIIVMSAAVADFTPEKVAEQKIKKTDSSSNISLVATVDILSEMGKMKTNGQFLTGFALETENEITNAISKLKRKNLDLVVLNTLADEGAGFGTETNKVTLIDKKENITDFPLKSKSEVAVDIVNKIIELNHA